MSKSFRSNTYDTRCLPFCLALVLAGATGCGSDTSAPNHGGAGATQSAGGAAAGGQSTAGAPNSPGTGGTGTAGASGGSAGSGTGGGTAGGGTAGSGTAGGGTAGSGTAGGGTAGSGTAGGSGGTTGAGCSTFKLCDGFEGDAPGMGASPWKVTGGAAVTVVTDQFNGGMHSVHIAAPDTQNFTANISETKTFPAADFWGRAFLRFKAVAGGHQMYIAVNLAGDQLRLLNRLGSDNAQVNFQTGDKFYDTGFKIPQEKWFCYEWHVTTSAVTISVDGMARPVTVPGIKGGTSLSLGFQRYAPGGGAGELWIDDVAVNDTQIGCN